jgi:hypothetical protein
LITKEEAVIVEVAISLPRFKDETVIDDPTRVENNPLFKFREETPRVETNALLTVREDRIMEEPTMDDPTKVE